MVRLFSPNRECEVQSFILKLVNNNCPDLRGVHEGPRIEGRVNLTVPMMLVPADKKKLALDRAFTAVSKEFSSMGVAVVLREPMGIDEAILGFRQRQEVTWIRAKAKHLSPIGGGFFQLGFRMIQRVYPVDYPGLDGLYF